MFPHDSMEVIFDKNPTEVSSVHHMGRCTRHGVLLLNAFYFLMVLIVEEMALAFVSAVTLSEYCR